MCVVVLGFPDNDHVSYFIVRMMMRCVSVQGNVSRGDEIVTAVRQFVIVDGQTVISGC